MRSECQICMHHCSLKLGQKGKCGARENKDGRIISSNYGRLTALALDPIEKKPLKQFYPGNMILSVGSYGCNLRCPYCQNYQIAACGSRDQTVNATPNDLVMKAKALECESNIGLAFTYNEPLVGVEFVRDTAKLAKAHGLKTVVVTNGSVTEETLDSVLPFIDAMNIDLKGFTKSYYEKLGGDLGTVKTFIQKSAERCHIEVTTLVVPGENDLEEEMVRLSEWIASFNSHIPLHVTRFFPTWKMTDRPPTPIETIHALADTARASLKYVYTGNC